MDYRKLYISIIEHRKCNDLLGYTEEHHIVPKCLGGGDEINNLVRLSPREHYICHYLLWKMYNTKEKYKLLNAFMMMHAKSKSHELRYMNSRLYEKAKLVLSENNSKKYKGKNNPNYGNVWVYNKHNMENKCISKNVLEDYLNTGWEKGRCLDFMRLYDKNNNKIDVKRDEVPYYLENGYHFSKNSELKYLRTYINPETKHRLKLYPEQYMQYVKYKQQGYISFQEYRMQKNILKEEKIRSMGYINLKNESSRRKTIDDLINEFKPNINKLKEFSTLKEASKALGYSKNVIRQAYRSVTGQNDVRKGLKHKHSFEKTATCIVCGKTFKASSKGIKYCSKKCADKHGIINYHWISNGKDFKRVLLSDYKETYEELGYYRIKPCTNLPKEQWNKLSDTDYRKEIIYCRKGFSDYQIDTEGNIYGKYGGVLHPSVNYKGYLIAQLRHENGKVYGVQVHRLIAEQFISNPDNKPLINHIDGNRANNCINNLQWVTASEAFKISFEVFNRKPSVTRKIYGKNIKTNELVEFNSMAEAARFVGCGRGSIQHVASGRKKSAKGYFWSYVPFE